VPIEPDIKYGSNSLALLFSAMDYLVFEAIGAELGLLSAEPTWYSRLWGFDEENHTLIDRIPFLECFLPEAFVFWRNVKEGRFQSDFWTQTDSLGEDIHLLAYAVAVGGRRFLLVRLAQELYEEREKWQVYAHETAIQLKAIERLKNEVEATAKALSAANEKLNELSRQDPLTGVYNRRHFEHIFELELRRTYRSHHPISILFMDIDYFKSINDTFGHDAGDECLRSIGRLLQASLKRSEDIIARLGGEEFAIVLPGIDSNAALHIAQGISQEVRNMKFTHAASESPLSITVSIGVYTRPIRGEETMSKILLSVDEALYRAKQEGRDRVVVAPPSSDQ
jgi:diguanylate cyclase (GGDEF)-like protein